MADTKITALAAITTVDPAADVLPIVDISDTSMAASGTTKKITTNQILGAGGTATLASATITGDLTVDTSTLKVDSANNRVGIGTASPANACQVQGTGQATVTPVVIGDQSALSLIDSAGLGNNGGMLVLGASVASGMIGQVAIKSLLSDGTQNGTANLAFFTRGATSDSTLTERYRIAANGIATWSNVGGVAGTAMTLNANGLGIGRTPANKLDIGGTGTQTVRIQTTTSGDPTLTFEAAGADGCSILYDRTNGGMRFDVSSITAAMRLSTTGNVGIGVTPSAWNTAFRGLDISTGGAIAGSSDSVRLFSNSAFNTAGNNVYKNAATAGRYDIQGNVHTWNISTNTPSAGGTITFSPAMTLDASGNLLVGTTGTSWQTVAGFYYFAGSSLNITRSANPSLLLNRLTSDGVIVDFRRSSSAVGDISVTTTGTTYNSASDYRLKESVAPLSGGLARVSALKPSIYKWKSDGSNGEGFLAHELAEVVPAAVTGEKDAVNEDGSIKSQGIDMSRVVPILVAAIQELTARVQTLETR